MTSEIKVFINSKKSRFVPCSGLMQAKVHLETAFEELVTNQKVLDALSGDSFDLILTLELRPSSCITWDLKEQNASLLKENQALHNRIVELKSELSNIEDKFPDY